MEVSPTADTCAKFYAVCLMKEPAREASNVRTPKSKAARKE